MIQSRLYAKWTKTRLSELKRLREEGFSASEIAQRLGYTTRDAVLGKIWRMGMCKKTPPRRGAGFSLEKYQARMQRANEKKRAVRWAIKPWLADLAEQREQEKKKEEEKKLTRARFVAGGMAKTSPAYRKHLPKISEMSKSDLRAMLKAAVENTHP